jgi:hypothetical protein
MEYRHHPGPGASESRGYVRPTQTDGSGAAPQAVVVVMAGVLTAEASAVCSGKWQAAT